MAETARIYHTLLRVFAYAASRGIATSEAADELAVARRTAGKHATPDGA